MPVFRINPPARPFAVGCALVATVVLTLSLIQTDSAPVRVSAVPVPSMVAAPDAALPPAKGVNVHHRPTIAEMSAATRFTHNGRVYARTRASSTVVGSVVPDGTPLLPTLAHHLTRYCTDTGDDGDRVQAVYAVESGQTNRYDAVLPFLRSYSADVDDTFELSARKTGGGRQVRWVTGSGCEISVLDVTLPAGSLANFEDTEAAMQSAGYVDPARKYLIYADANDICGLGDLYDDSNPTDNDSDGTYPEYARMDTACWQTGGITGDGSVPAHELVHTLGGVQPDAPHHTANGHCTDASEVMCYVDGPGVVLTQTCPTTLSWMLDCGDDDYFNTDPATGTYLDTHWNTARSSFLDDLPAVDPAPTVSITGAAGLHAGLATVLTADASVAATYQWTLDAPECLAGATDAAQLTVMCPANGTGVIGASVVAVPVTGDGQQASATHDVTLDTQSVLDPTVSLGVSPTTSQPGAARTLTVSTAYHAAPGDPASPARLQVQLYAQDADGAHNLAPAVVVTGPDGTYSTQVYPEQSTTYHATLVGDPGWTTRSATVAVAVQPPFAVLPGVKVDDHHITAGHRDTVTGWVRTTASSTRLSGQRLQLWVSTAHGTWHHESTATSAGSGLASFSVSPGFSSRYQIHYTGGTAGEQRLLAGSSATTKVGVRPTASLHASALVGRTHEYTISGTVSPGLAGRRVYYVVSGRRAVRATTDSHGRYSLRVSYRGYSVGHHNVYLQVPASSHNDAANGAVHRIRVR